MLKYLIFTKGKLAWHSWGTWIESLSTVKRRLNFGFQCGLPYESMLVLERKSPCECIYRLKKFDGKWHNSSLVDVYQDSFAEAIAKFTESHIQEYIDYRSFCDMEYNESPSMFEWVTRNDQSIRCFIFWLYNNNYITIA